MTQCERGQYMGAQRTVESSGLALVYLMHNGASKHPVVLFGACITDRRLFSKSQHCLHVKPNYNVNYEISVTHPSKMLKGKLRKFI